MANIDILKSSADYDRIYYIEYQGAIRQCKLIATAGTNRSPFYILQIAGVGVRHVKPKDDPFLSHWWTSSTVESVLAESPEDLSKGIYLTDSYGSTCNAFNSRFVKPFLPRYAVCGCGGGIHFWKWDGIRPQSYSLTGDITWRIDKDGFHCILNAMASDRYPSEAECRKANRINEPVKF